MRRWACSKYVSYKLSVSRLDEILVDWQSKLKIYPHFDKIMSVEKILGLVLDPEKVQKNSFFPLILYPKIENRFKAAPKRRDIFWTARRDSYIYTQYREYLLKKYEEILLSKGIYEIPIAYRTIPKSNKNASGKSNIEFALDAFDEIRNLSNCTAIALDIKGFFDNLSHDILKSNLQKILKVSKLPKDYYAIYKSITNYKFVDYFELLEVLGLFGDVVVRGKTVKGHLKSKKEIKKQFKDNHYQICSQEDFKKLVCDKKSGILKKPNESIGIPQGTPISDIFANIYMIDFDCELSKIANEHGVYYRRYSDDILLIVPEKSEESFDYNFIVSSLLKKYCGSLEIKTEKSLVVKFRAGSLSQSCEGIFPKKCARRPFEYLGFVFDGMSVCLRSSTISNLYRKATHSAQREGHILRKRYPTLSSDLIIERYNFSALFQKFGKVKDFEEVDDFKKWTFWTYVKRSEKEIKIRKFKGNITRQVRKLKDRMKKELVGRL